MPAVDITKKLESSEFIVRLVSKRDGSAVSPYTWDFVGVQVFHIQSRICVECRDHDDPHLNLRAAQDAVRPLVDAWKGIVARRVEG
jgi:hypothetical protein